MKGSKTDDSSTDTKSVAFIYPWIAIALALCFLGYWVIVKNYEHNSHNTDSYIDSDEYRAFMVEWVNYCGETTSKTDQQAKRCNEIEEIIRSFANISDLRAQQTMAYATRGILVSSWFQVAVSALAFSLVGATFVATWKMLQQAANTSNYASRTLEAAQDAANAAKTAERAYVDIELVCEFTEKEGNKEFRVTPTIANFGKTPARNIVFSVWPVEKTRNRIDMASYRAMVSIHMLAAGIPATYNMRHRDDPSEITHTTSHSYNLCLAVLWSFDDVNGNTFQERYIARAEFQTSRQGRIPDAVASMTPIPDKYLTGVKSIVFRRGKGTHIENWKDVEITHEHQRKRQPR